MAKQNKTFIIHTASDPVAGDLWLYLDERGFTVQAQALTETARILVDLTTKQKLTRAIKAFLTQERQSLGPHRITIDEVPVSRLEIK